MNESYNPSKRVVLSLEDAKKLFKTEIKVSELSTIVTDIDFEKYLELYLKSNAYDFKQPFEENWKLFLQYCAIRKFRKND